MTRIFLKIVLFGLGLSAIGIGLSMFVFGVEPTAHFFAAIVNQFSNNPKELGGFSSASVDSEFRFFAVFWIAYGGILLKTARNLGAHMKQVPLLSCLFFVGGVGRIFSMQAVGAPHQLFIVLMSIELALPILIVGLWSVVRKQA